MLPLASRAVQGEHQLFPETLPERVTRREALELADHLSVFSDGELRLDPVLERAEPLLLQPRGLGLERRLTGEVGERRAAPQIQRVVERADGGTRVDRQQAPGVSQDRSEPCGVELRRLRLEAVARSAPLEPFGAERLAQVRGVALERVAGRLGWLIAPDLVDEHLGGDEMVGAEEQVGEDRTLLGSAERDRAVAFLEHLDRPEHPELHAADRSP